MGRPKTKPKPKIMARIAQRNERACGPCRACCYALGIATIKKPTWTHCAQECPQGCRLHQDPAYPAECRHYFCVWRLGRQPETERPDQTGLLIDMRQTTRGPLLTAWELWANAGSEPIGEQVLTRIAATQLIALIPWRLPNNVDTAQAHRWAKERGLPLPQQKVLLGPPDMREDFLKRPERQVAGGVL